MRNNTTFWAESRCQEQIVSLLRKGLPKNYRILSIPNGRFKADPRTIARLKREGLTPGAPDLLLIRSDGWCAGIEVKAGKGKLSPEQAEWGEWAVYGGGEFTVVRSVADLEAALAAWNVPMKARVAA